MPMHNDEWIPEEKNRSAGSKLHEALVTLFLLAVFCFLIIKFLFF